MKETGIKKININLRAYDKSMLTIHKQDIKIWRDQNIYSKTWNLLQQDQIHDYLKRSKLFPTSKQLERPLTKWGESPPIYTWIQDNQSIITDPLFSQLIPQNPQQIHISLNLSLQIFQQILDEIFSPHLYDLLLEISPHLEDEIRIWGYVVTLSLLKSLNIPVIITKLIEL